jgi:hypothetical protein
MYVALLKSSFILYDTFVLPLDAYWHTYYSRYYWGLGRLFLHGPASRYSTYYSHFSNAFDIWTTKSIHVMAECGAGAITKTWPLFYNMLNQCFMICQACCYKREMDLTPFFHNCKIFAEPYYAWASDCIMRSQTFEVIFYRYLC